MEGANISELLLFSGGLACSWLLALLVFVGTRASRVLRTFAFLPRKVVDVTDPRAVRLELDHDDLAFSVVRGRARVLAVLDAVEVGDEVELWHDRAERSFGSTGAVHLLAVDGRILFRAEDEARESAAAASRDRRVALPDRRGTPALGGQDVRPAPTRGAHLR